jgi:hypothetical protein
MDQLSEAQKKIESLNSLFIPNASEAKIHLAFLFASPLVIKMAGRGGKDTFNTMPLLEFSKEFKDIHSSIKETNKNVKVRRIQATTDNISIVLG